MDLVDLRRRAQAAVDPLAWAYYQATADAGTPGSESDARRWAQIALIPRVLRGRASVTTTIRLGAAVLATPVVVAATAAHGMAHPDGELATAAGAARAGALMVYSNSATVEVGRFGAAASGPWWAQVYVMQDRGVTRDYLRRSVAAGAGAIVLTVDNPGAVAEPDFRFETQARIRSSPGNYPQWTWPEMSANIEPALTPDDITWVRELTGLPVHVKGILHPGDAEMAIDVGASGIIVSNHGRRQVVGVLPVSQALGPVVDAVAGRGPVTVDGGIRSGADAARALALGATAVGIGRPVIWGLAADGTQGVETVVGGLTSQLRQALAALGAASPADLDRSFIRLPRW